MRAPPPKLSEKNLKRVYHAGLETIGKDSELTGDAAFDDFMRRAEAAEEGNRNELLEDFRTRYIRTKYSLDERREQVLELKEAYARLKTVSDLVTPTRSILFIPSHSSPFPFLHTTMISILPPLYVGVF